MNNKYKILFVFALILSVCINIFTIRKCSSNKEVNNNNIVALTDSIHYYKTKNNE